MQAEAATEIQERQPSQVKLMSGIEGRELINPEELERAANSLIFPTEKDLLIPFSERINRLEVELEKQPQADIPVRHEFIDGLYRREVTFPAGMIAVGAEHTKPHMDVLLSGEMIIATENGPAHIVAPMTMTTSPGGKKAGIALTDVVWATYHANPENITDPDEIERGFLSEKDYAGIVERKARLADQAVIQARSDYKRLLDDLGMTEAQVRAEVECQTDYLPDFDVGKLLTVKPSPIQGVGMFAAADIHAGQRVATARVGDMRTPAGRLVNHSPEPNAVMLPVGNEVALFSTCEIRAGDEVVTDYRETIKTLSEARS